MEMTMSDVLSLLKERRDAAERYNTRENKMVHDIRKVELAVGTADALIVEIERLTAERDALQQRLEWVKRDYAAGEYTAMALNLFDGEIAPDTTPPPADTGAGDAETVDNRTPFHLRKARDLIYDGRSMAELSRIEIAMLNIIIGVEIMQKGERTS
jgi:hypothetical protein